MTFTIEFWEFFLVTFLLAICLSTQTLLMAGCSLVLLILTGYVLICRPAFYQQSRYYIGFALVLLIYPILSDFIVPTLPPHRFDTTLLNLSNTLFPWLNFQHITHTYWLTEVLSLCYSLTLFIDVVAFLYFLVYKENTLCAQMQFTWYIAFTCYILLPVEGPHSLGVIPDWSTFGPLTKFNQLFAKAITGTIDCFPSMHTCSILQWLLFVKRYGSTGLFWALLPFSLLVVLSTLYLNYHYAMDVVCGAALAFGTHWYMKRYPLSFKFSLSLPKKTNQLC